jgi:putative endonuclease
MALPSEFVTYIITTHFGTYYTGITNSIIRRWKEHNSGNSSYLSRFKPKEVVYIYYSATRSEAYRLEQKIKRIGAKKYLLIQKFT